MCQVVFSVPDEVLFDIKMNREQADQFVIRYKGKKIYD